MLKKGDKVLICDGLNTGVTGVVGGSSERGSVAVCIPGYKGLSITTCVGNGVFEPDYALLRVTEENEKALSLLVQHLSKPHSVEQAVQQFTGMHYSEGQDVRAVCSGMGLTQEEWLEVKRECPWLSLWEAEQIEEYLETL